MCGLEELKYFEDYCSTFLPRISKKVEKNNYRLKDVAVL